MSYFSFKYLGYLLYRYPAFKLKNQHHGFSFADLRFTDFRRLLNKENF